MQNLPTQTISHDLNLSATLRMSKLARHVTYVAMTVASAAVRRRVNFSSETLCEVKSVRVF